MKQTHTETDEALAHIRRNTAAPIQRFLDSVIAARLEETAGPPNRKPVRPSKLGILGMAKGLRRSFETLSFFLKKDLCLQSVARVIHRIRRRQQPRNEP